MSALLDKLLHGDAASNDEVLKVLRQKAQKNVLQFGLPSLRDERWKYTSLKLLERRDYSELDGVDQEAAIEQAKTIIDDCPSAGLVVFVGDHCLLSRSLVSGSYDWLQSLSELLEGGSETAQQLFIADQQVQAGSTDGFIWLNLARSQSGLVLNLPEGLQIDQPLHIVYLNISDDSNTDQSAQASNIRHHWKLAKQAKLDIVEHYFDCSAGLANIYRTVDLGKNAEINWLSIQHAGNDFALLQHNHIQQQASSCCRQWTLDLGARLARQETRVDLAGEQADYQYAGLLLGRQRQHHDQHVLVQHNAKHCTSQQTYRSVLDDHARGVVNTAAKVAVGADGSDVQQNTASLLLSNNAEMDAKPELEIHADEVVASHGATIGQLDEDALFYLRSRGIHQDQARQMLIGGFVGNIVESISHAALREHADRLVSKQLEQIL